MRITWSTEDGLGTHNVASILRDEAIESRLLSLRNVAMELLSAVESLKTTPVDGENRAVKLHDEVRRFETDLIRTALIRTGGNQLQAARLLGVKHTTLNAKIKRYRISTDGSRHEGQATDQEIAA